MICCLPTFDYNQMITDRLSDVSFSILPTDSTNRDRRKQQLSVCDYTTFHREARKTSSFFFLRSCIRIISPIYHNIYFTRVAAAVTSRRRDYIIRVYPWTIETFVHDCAHTRTKRMTSKLLPDTSEQTTGPHYCCAGVNTRVYITVNSFFFVFLYFFQMRSLQPYRIRIYIRAGTSVYYVTWRVRVWILYEHKFVLYTYI